MRRSKKEVHMGKKEERWKSSIIGSSLLLPIVVMRRRASVSCMKTELIIGKMLWHIKTWHTQSTMRVAKALTFREMTSAERKDRASATTGQALIEVIVFGFFSFGVDAIWWRWHDTARWRAKSCSKLSLLVTELFIFVNGAKTIRSRNDHDRRLFCGMNAGRFATIPLLWSEM